MAAATAARTAKGIKITPLGKKEKEKRTQNYSSSRLGKLKEKKKLIGIAIASMIM